LKNVLDVETNRFTTENKSIYFKDPNDLIETFNNLNENDFENLKNEMISIAKKRYTWEIISKKYAELF